MTTTPSTASQAPAVSAREEARKHVHSLTARTTELVGEVIAKGMLGVLEECIEMQLTMNELQARAIAAEDRAEKAEQYTQVALGIKDSLEARLAEIQRGVEENLQRYQAEVIINASDAFMEENDEGKYVLLGAVRTLFDSTYDIGTPEVIQLLRDITEQCGASEMYYIPGDLEDRIKDMLAKYDQSESKP